MTSPDYWLAQVNIAYMTAPLDDPLMQDFVLQLDGVNAIADASPGFVWRLQTDEGDFTSVRAYEDDTILFNMSVWESLEALHHYVYKSAHLGVLRRRRDWFEPTREATLALWWVDAGQIPSIEQAKTRLEQLRRDGPTPHVFTFRNAFPPPDRGYITSSEVDAEFCA